MSNNRLPDNVIPIWNSDDAIATAQAFHDELDNAERGLSIDNAWFTSQARHRKARRMDRIAVILLMMLMAAIGCLTLLAFAPNANADIDSEAYAYAAHYAGAVCTTLDDYPSTAGMLGIMQAIVEDGLTYYQAGQAVALSVTESCPRHAYLLDLFVDLYGSRAVA